jgi:hypothetical protein
VAPSDTAEATRTFPAANDGSSTVQPSRLKALVRTVEVTPEVVVTPLSSMVCSCSRTTNRRPWSRFTSACTAWRSRSSSAVPTCARTFTFTTPRSVVCDRTS